MKPSCDSYRSLVIVGNAKACQNKPLDDEAKRRIYEYLEGPSASGWSDISGIIVNSPMAGSKKGGPVISGYGQKIRTRDGPGDQGMETYSSSRPGP